MTTLSATESTDAPAEAGGAVTPSSNAVRVQFLDGMRGLAALYVVLHHAFHEAVLGIGYGHAPHVLVRALTWLNYGRFSVAVFIVLSGYCLMLPVARSRDGRLRGGWREYLRRRARRILPPYFAALLLALLVIFLTPLRAAATPNWSLALPAFSPGVIASHILLVHNLSPAWALKIDPPFWSIATEWQLYFLLPVLLLPVWRRFGLAALVVTAFGVGCAPYLAPRVGDQLMLAQFWFVGLFALGMAAAVVGFGAPSHWRDRARALPWGAVGAALLVAVEAAALARPGFWDLHGAGGDVLVGLAAACLIVCYAGAVSGRRRPIGLSFLESRPMAALGAFSYSLYLIHYPLLSLMHLPLQSLQVAPLTAFAVLATLGTAVCIGAAWYFHLLFERPFMPGHPRSLRAAASNPRKTCQPDKVLEVDAGRGI